jgi:hypothetical protein
MTVPEVPVKYCLQSAGALVSNTKQFQQKYSLQLMTNDQCIGKVNVDFDNIGGID